MRRPGPSEGWEEAPVSPLLSAAGPVSAAAEATKRCCLQKAGSSGKTLGSESHQPGGPPPPPPC